MKCTQFYNTYHKPFTTWGSSKHTQNRRQQDRQYNYKLKTVRCSRSQYPHGEAGSITHSEGVPVAVLMKHAKCTALPYFSTLSHKQKHFQGGGKKTPIKHKCMFWLSTQLLSETYLILKRIQHNININDIALHVKHRLFLLRFNETCISSADFLQNIDFHENPSSGRQCKRQSLLNEMIASCSKYVSTFQVR